MSTRKQIARFEDVEEGEEFWSAEGRLYMKGTSEAPDNGDFIDSSMLGLRPDHAAGDPMKGCEAERAFREERRNFPDMTVPGRRFEEDELVLRGGFGVEDAEERIRFFAG